MVQNVKHNLSQAHIASQIGVDSISGDSHVDRQFSTGEHWRTAAAIASKVGVSACLEV